MLFKSLNPDISEMRPALWTFWYTDQSILVFKKLIGVKFLSHTLQVILSDAFPSSYLSIRLLKAILATMSRTKVFNSFQLICPFIPCHLLWWRQVKRRVKQLAEQSVLSGVKSGAEHLDLLTYKDFWRHTFLGFLLSSDVFPICKLILRVGSQGRS